ncbi:hypothetical protein AVEN_173086-1 [Araneus ventricosus]|uniref:Uncharacterized protein n=1 Tax=Araneus ventricosus TaxID=182803 RepID=A0A4Y2CU54_ARAVE|nr:hypothetical protein AVEN_105172-1 [Araneus ventricosus]GBM06805.1 hypothetical protein AVEN_173086-1 [Araneus ventricosus]
MLYTLWVSRVGVGNRKTHGIQEQRSRGSQSLFIPQLFNRDLFWRTEYAARALMFRLKKNQIMPPVRSLLVLQEFSDEEKACGYFNVSDIIDKEYIEENYL